MRLAGSAPRPRSGVAVAVLGGILVAAACASTPPPPARPAGASAGAPRHGTRSELSAVGPKAELCEHRVPREVCTRHNPHLVPRFQAAGDWCGEHGVPESQCHECHPGLSFEPLPSLPPDADVRRLSQKGEDVPSLAAHAVPGKVTIFDFYADWCAPCRKIDAHVYALLGRRSDLALRKLNVVSWETPLARRHLANVPTLPYVVVYGRDGRLVRAISGLDLDALDAAIAAGATR